MPKHKSTPQAKPSEQVTKDLASIDISTVEEKQGIGSEEHFLDAQLEIEIRKEHLVMLRANNKSRIEYAKKTFSLTVSWITAIFIICIFSGFNLGRFKLDNSVLIALITTTTINVFAFFVLVMKYLFNTGAANTITRLKAKRP